MFHAGRSDSALSMERSVPSAARDGRQICRFNFTATPSIHVSSRGAFRFPSDLSLTVLPRLSTARPQAARDAPTGLRHPVDPATPPCTECSRHGPPTDPTRRRMRTNWPHRNVPQEQASATGLATYREFLVNSV